MNELMKVIGENYKNYMGSSMLSDDDVENNLKSAKQIYDIILTVIFHHYKNITMTANDIQKSMRYVFKVVDATNYYRLSQEETGLTQY